MSALDMPDMIVLLPGIMGSVLQEKGVDLWAISGRSIFRAVSSLGGDLEKLVLKDDDHQRDDLGDGIEATALMPDRHIIPGLFKVDGYSTISRMIRGSFNVVPGRLDDQTPANYYEFYYDWRRDNRVAARKLKRLIDRQLPIWRRHRNDPEAKVIILAHSMGGIIARHYLEVLEGWVDCRRLVTFGTPYRGSVKALQYVANGYKNLLVDLTEAVRSFTSIYQLLPIYPVVKEVGGYRRLVEVDNIPNVDRRRAQDARDFHLAIVDQVSAHSKDERYSKGFQTIPIVGIGQPTLQSGELSAGGAQGAFVTGEQLPDIKDLPDGGDGTVPYTSAIPFEFSQQYRECTFVEQHGSLQSNDRVLEYVFKVLKGARNVGLLEALGPEKETTGISLAVDDLYRQGEPVVLRAKPTDNAIDPDELTARIEPVEKTGAAIEVPFHPDGAEWKLTLEGLPPNLYRAEVKTHGFAEEFIKPVHGLFEVVSI